MVAQVISFFQRSPRFSPSADWTQQELAEFYRVESALIRAGIRVGTDRGLSDENEPWFIFYRADDGEVVIHFARIDGEYIIAGPAYEEIARGTDFSGLVRNMVARHPLIQRGERGGNVSVHPAALLIAVVGTAFFKTGEARAAETGATNANSGHSRPVLMQNGSSGALAAATGSVAQGAPYDVAHLPANQAVLVLAAALLASDYRLAPESLSDDGRAAIAAAAAALDFSDAPSLYAGTGHAATFSSQGFSADRSPAQTVSSVLSLMALFATASISDERIIDPAAIQSGHASPLEGHKHVANDLSESDWSLEVRLSWADAPNIEAVQLVRSVAGDTTPQKIAVIDVEKLPSALAEIIARGHHYVVPAPSVPQGGASATPTADAPADPTPHSPDVIDGSTGGSGTTGDGGITGGSSNPGKTPAQPSSPSPDPVTPPTHSGFASKELVKQFVDYFISHTDYVEIITQGFQVVIYDARVLQDPHSIEHLTSITFNFFDGSSVNLIGDHSSFLNDGNFV